MQKRIWLVLFLTILIWSMVTAQVVRSHESSDRSLFRIAGVILGQDSGRIVLTYIDAAGKKVRDTSAVLMGHFRFEGTINGPTLSGLIGNISSASLDDPHRTLIFLEPGNMKVELKRDDFQNSTVYGSNTEKDLEQLRICEQKVHDSLAILRVQRTALRKADTIVDKDQLLAAVNAAYLRLQRQYDKICFNFIESHPSSFAGPYLLASYRNAKIPLDSAKAIFQKFPSQIKSSMFGEQVLTMIQDDERALKTPALIGASAPNFNQVDLNGDSLGLINFRGSSYVLLDFWGSTCPPCRAFTPKLKQLYSSFHSKGLDIISISDDTDRKRWRDAIDKDGMTAWHNIMDFAEVSGNKTSPIGIQYNVQYIPAMILLDPKGVIVGRYMGQEIFSEDDLVKDLHGLLGR